MKPDFLFDKSKEPNQDNVLQLLGQNAERLNDLDSFCENEVGQLIYEWKFYTKKSGWTRKALLKKRNLFFLSPQKDFFTITFVFGDKAVEAVEKSGLPDNVKSELGQARKYMEGRGIKIDITNDDDLEIVKQLLMIKIGN